MKIFVELFNKCVDKFLVFCYYIGINNDKENIMFTDAELNDLFDQIDDLDNELHHLIVRDLATELF